MSDTDDPIRWSYLGRNYRMLFACDDVPKAAAALATPRQLEQAGFIRADLPLSTADLDLIRQALYTGQRSNTKLAAQQAFERVSRVLQPLQTDAPSELWGVWGERYNCAGFWIQAKAGSSEPLQTSRADAERRAANLNREQETRTDSVGWRYEARLHARPAADSAAKPVTLADVIQAARESRDAGRYAAALGHVFEAIEMLGRAGAA